VLQSTSSKVDTRPRIASGIAPWIVLLNTTMSDFGAFRGDAQRILTRP